VLLIFNKLIKHDDDALHCILSSVLWQFHNCELHYVNVVLVSCFELIEN